LGSTLAAISSFHDTLFSLVIDCRDVETGPGSYDTASGVMSQINKYTKDKSLLYKNKTARSIDIWYYYIYGWELGKPIGAKIKLENILIKVKLR